MRGWGEKWFEHSSFKSGCENAHWEGGIWANSVQKWLSEPCRYLGEECVDRRRKQRPRRWEWSLLGMCEEQRGGRRGQSRVSMEWFKNVLKHIYWHGDIHNVVRGGKQVTIQTVFAGYCFSFLTLKISKHITQYFHTPRHSLQLRPGAVNAYQEPQRTQPQPKSPRHAEPYRLSGITIMLVEATASL